MSSKENRPSKLSGIFGRWGKKQPEEVVDTKEPEIVPEAIDETELLGEQAEEFSPPEVASDAGVESPETPPEDAAVQEEMSTLSDASEALPVDELASEDSETEAVVEEQRSGGIFGRWRSGLKKSSQQFGSALGGLLRGKTKIDDDMLEELETLLLVADVGLETTQVLLETLQERVKRARSADVDIFEELKQLMVDMLSEPERSLDIHPDRTNVMMVVGVNGVGKTTSIGKLTKRFMSEGQSVVLAAGDTFRAAAVEQLQVWGERNEVPVIAQSTGADSASVIYDALESSRARNANVLIADTAGRLHNKGNLMEELSKVIRVIKKQDDTAPHETLLVLDAGTGQNALSQAREFAKAAPLSGLILTKLDGTAKGGVVFSLIEQTGLPVKFVGLGEGVDDLAPFDPNKFVDALLAS